MASQEGGRSLPKFGEWDVNDPASAEGFTVIFNKARADKKNGGSLLATVESSSKCASQIITRKSIPKAKGTSGFAWVVKSCPKSQYQGKFEALVGVIQLVVLYQVFWIRGCYKLV